jgi:ribosomal protein L35
MPKQKTNKSLIKRVRVTKTGKVLRRGSHIRHLMLKKSKSNIRRQKLMRPIPGRMAIKIKKIVPVS